MRSPSLGKLSSLPSYVVAERMQGHLNAFERATHAQAIASSTGRLAQAWSVWSALLNLEPPRIRWLHVAGKSGASSMRLASNLEGRATQACHTPIIPQTAIAPCDQADTERKGALTYEQLKD